MMDGRACAIAYSSSRALWDSLILSWYRKFERSARMSGGGRGGGGCGGVARVCLVFFVYDVPKSNGA